MTTLSMERNPFLAKNQTDWTNSAVAKRKQILFGVTCKKCNCLQKNCLSWNKANRL